MHMCYKARFACVFRIVSGCIRYPAGCEPRKTAVQVRKQTHTCRAVKCAAGQSRHRCPCVWVHPSLTHPKFPVESPILLHALCSGWAQHHHHLLVSLSKDSPYSANADAATKRRSCVLAAKLTWNLEIAVMQQQQPVAFNATHKKIVH